MVATSTILLMLAGIVAPTLADLYERGKTEKETVDWSTWPTWSEETSRPAWSTEETTSDWTTQLPDACSELGRVSHVQIFEVGPNLVVVWQEPQKAVECNLKYLVTYEADDRLQSGETKDLHYAFDHKPYPCVSAVITITPQNVLNDVEGAVHQTRYDSDVGELVNVTVHQEMGLLRAEWEDPPNSERCNFTYSIEYSDGLNGTLTFQSLEPFFDFVDLEVTPCVLVNVSVTPTATTTGVTGKASKVPYEIVADEVLNLGVTSDDEEIVTKWDAPLNTRRCNLSYEVVHSDKGCFTTEVSVVPVSSTGKQGRIGKRHIETEIDAVFDLHAEIEGKTLTVKWKGPENWENCSVSYVVRVGQKNSSAELSQFTTNILAEPCYIGAVTVWPVSATMKVGKPSNTTYEAGVGAVIGLKLSRVGDDDLVGEWEAPENSQRCSLTYLVEYDDGREVHISVVSATKFTFGYKCGVAKMTVAPHTDTGKVGEEASASYDGDCKSWRVV